MISWIKKKWTEKRDSTRKNIEIEKEIEKKWIEKRDLTRKNIENMLLDLGFTQDNAYGKPSLHLFKKNKMEIWTSPDGILVSNITECSSPDSPDPHEVADHIFLGYGKAANGDLKPYASISHLYSQQA